MLGDQEASSEWIPGIRKVRTHSRYRNARLRTLRRLHPKVKELLRTNSLWHRILREHNADRKYWLVDDEPHPQDTKEWLYLEENIMPSILISLERTCKLEQILCLEGDRRVFSFADTFAHFLLNEDRRMGFIRPETIPAIARQLAKENLSHPKIPKHKIMSKNKAAIIIQRNVRGWLVRKQNEIEQMREFWKVMRSYKWNKPVLKTRNDYFVNPAVFKEIFGKNIDDIPEGISLEDIKKDYENLDDEGETPQNEDCKGSRKSILTSDRE